MFEIEDYFKSSDIFNEILVKRFEENFNPESDSRLWVTPGHIVFTSNNTKIHTCDARPYDFSTSPSESETDELLSTASTVLEIIFDTESSSTRLLVILTNGDVQIFEYRTLLYEWARIGYFNVNIVSPNSNNNHIIVNKVLISHHQNMIYWSQKSGTSNSCFDLHKREVPLNGVREITQSAIGVPQNMLKNCLDFELIEIRDNICVIPHLPNNVNFYIIISARSHMCLFNIEGKLLWRGIVGDSPIDFISLCTKTIGLWTSSGNIKVCKLLDNAKNYAYLLHNETLLSLTLNGEINSKMPLNIIPESIQDSFIIKNFMYIFMDDYKCFEVHNIKNGHKLQSFDLESFSPITGIWSHSSSIPHLGFYSNSTIYKLNHKPLSTLLVSEPPCNMKSFNLSKFEYIHLFLILRDSLHHKLESCDVPSLKCKPKTLQSEALLFALQQSCRENGFKSEDFPVQKMKKLLKEDNVLPDTKLKDLLSPIVQCFKKLEDCRISQFEHSE